MLNLNEGIQYGYDIKYTYRNRQYTFPANTKIYNISIFAGGSSAPKFRYAYIYSNKYGGNPNEWYKVKGFALANGHLLEIHWVEHKLYGKYRGKVKYVLKKEHERKNLLQRYVKKSNSMNFSNKNHSFQAKKTNQDFSENIAEEKTELEHPLKNSMITRQILTPIQKIKHRLIEPKKKNESEKENDFLTPIKNKFKLNNISPS